MNGAKVMCVAPGGCGELLLPRTARIVARCLGKLKIIVYVNLSEVLFIWFTTPTALGSIDLRVWVRSNCAHCTGAVAT